MASLDLQQSQNADEGPLWDPLFSNVIYINLVYILGPVGRFLLLGISDT